MLSCAHNVISDPPSSPVKRGTEPSKSTHARHISVSSAVGARHPQKKPHTSFSRFFSRPLALSSSCPLTPTSRRPGQPPLPPLPLLTNLQSRYRPKMEGRPKKWSRALSDPARRHRVGLRPFLDQSDRKRPRARDHSRSYSRNGHSTRHI